MMATPLLATKLYAPPLRPYLVPRPELIERLNDGLRVGRKLTLVSAPAGYGKTTLLSAWLRTIARPSAWLSLDEGDNDPARFFNYFVAALQNAHAELGRTVDRLLESPQLPPVETLLTELINDIASQSRSFVLALDDYQVIAEQSIHQAVSFLLERQPPQMHLAILSRQDPPLPLSRLRGRGQITEFRQRDLRFTPQETTAFLNQVMGLHLDPSDVAALDRHTEGWVAGLQMAAFALQSRIAAGGAESSRRFIASFSGRHHFILDYLTDQVLSRQSEPIQRFLLRTCILERMCGDLCDALVGQPAAGEPSQRVLEHLQQANLFVVPLDDERHWYRYHSLFAELLRARLQEHTPDRRGDLHRRAAVWYDAHDLSAEAVHHALAIPDYELAAEVIERAIRQVPTWSSLSTSTFMGWLNRLPQAVIEARPWLRLFAGRVSYVSGKRESAIQTLCELERSLGQAPTHPDAERILLLAALDRASYAAVHGEVQQASQLVRRVLAELPPDEVNTRIRALSILGLSSFRAGDVREADRVFSSIIGMARAAGWGFAVASFLCNLAEIHVVRGRLRRAIQICEQAITLGAVDGRPTHMVAFAHLALGKILYEQNELPAAEDHLSQGLALLEHGQITIGIETGHAALALTRFAQGNAAGAAAAMDEAVRVAQANDIPRLSMLISAYQARLWLAQGRIGPAAQWADDYRRSEPGDYLREFEDLTLARVLLAQGEPSQAAQRLDAIVTAAEAAGRTGALIEALTVRALARQAMREGGGARDDLARAIILAEPAGYARVFVDHGPSMAQLLRTALSREAAADYAAALLALFRPSAGSRAPVSQSALVEPLTDREMEVLACLAEGLSNAEIGQRLSIALPTVKSHTRNIYGKLTVGSRKAAVARARTLGILP